MMRWAVIDAASLVVWNVVIWGGGDSPWPDMLTVALEADERCAPGWTYDPSPMASPRFLEPAPPVDG